jgi:hypothetical protein
VQRVDRRELAYMKKPCSARALDYIVEQYTGTEIDSLEFIPCDGLLVDPLTGFAPKDGGEQVFVYFVQSIEGGPIKIGSAMDVERRLRDLQTGSSTTLKLLASVRGHKKLETWVHGTLAAYRLNGEWFSDCWEVREVMFKLLRRASATETETATRD